MSDPANPLGLTQEKLGEIVVFAHQASSILEINDTETSETARILRGKLKMLTGVVEGARVTAKAPYLAAQRTIDGLAKVILEQINPQILRIDNLRMDYSRRFQAPAPMPGIPAASPMEYMGIPIVANPGFGDVPDLSALAVGASATPPVIRTRTTRDVEITDINQIPREFLVVDMVKLRKAMLTDNQPVAGARVIEKTSVLE